MLTFWLVHSFFHFNGIEVWNSENFKSLVNSIILQMCQIASEIQHVSRKKTSKIKFDHAEVNMKKVFERILLQIWLFVKFCI